LQGFVTFQPVILQAKCLSYGSTTAHPVRRGQGLRVEVGIKARAELGEALVSGRKMHAYIVPDMLRLCRLQFYSNFLSLLAL
jgi:hypothetical protein